MLESNLERQRRNSVMKVDREFEESGRSHQQKDPEKGKPLVILLIVLFGQGSWIALNGLWVELPLLVSLGIPEGFDIATWLVLIIQVANVGPLLFTIVNYLTPSKFQLELSTNYIITALGTLVALLLIFLWDKYSVWRVTGTEIYHSTALLICAFLLSIVDCTSSVAFTPFMSRFKKVYLTWYFVGEGFSALTPSIFALIQGVASNSECIANHTYITSDNGSHATRCQSWIPRQRPPRFGPSVYFAFIFAMALACFSSYCMLNLLPFSRSEQLDSRANSTKREKSCNDNYRYEMVTTDGDTTPRMETSEIGKETSMRSLGFYIYIFTLLGIVNALCNSILPSVQTFSAGAYGLTTYLVAATLACVSKPLSSFLVLLRPVDKLFVIGCVAVCGIIVGSYCMLTAFMSPSPPLQHTTIGRLLVVFAWVVSTGCFSYVHATIGWILRQESSNRTLLIWFGGITQVGSLIGACVMFIVVTTTDSLVPYYEDPCKDEIESCDVISLL